MMGAALCGGGCAAIRGWVTQIFYQNFRNSVLFVFSYVPLVTYISVGSWWFLEYHVI